MAQKITFNNSPKSGDTIKFNYKGADYTFTYADNVNISDRPKYTLSIWGGIGGGQAVQTADQMLADCPYLAIDSYRDYFSKDASGWMSLATKDGSPLSNIQVSSNFAVVEPLPSVGSSVINTNPVDTLPATTLTDKATSLTPASMKNKNTKYWILGLLVVLAGGYFVMKSKKK